MKILILVEPSRMNELWAIITINSYYQIISKQITKNVLIINNDMLNNYLNKNYIIITFSYNINNRLNLLKTEKVILINVDNYNHFKFEKLLTIINKEQLNFTIFDYNPINIKEINKKYKNIKIEYMPLLYNSYFEEHYNFQIDEHENNKDIDILFYGTSNPRRELILEKLKKKYNIHIIFINITGNSSDKIICNYIKRSKIILNIFFYDYNKIFDYYRNSYLIANKALLISEYPDNIDFDIEKNLINIDKYLIMDKYENLVDLVSRYLDNYNNIDINNIIENQYKWFSNNKLDLLIKNYFTINY